MLEHVEVEKIQELLWKKLVNKRLKKKLKHLKYVMLLVYFNHRKKVVLNIYSKHNIWYNKEASNYKEALPQ